ncbi:uncharacterized protein J8A68_003738 [[Candida] subhashii]|uniref:DUF171-domain-containing protein n=1 Tax=[Candida] subhashii TaxID=561895 RepID=A0A8J5UW63_9ASCO|nr:uncharacterized protein J8A68_003738 [[Candida] subhashii]KAG7662750.1 hypothetical protein J8A68_003738 [[Candida] subhashii]
MAKRKNTEQDTIVSTKKPTKSTPETKISICIPSTVISSKNAYNLQQITNIAYSIAKAATIYNVVEIVIVDIPEPQPKKHESEADVVVSVGVSDKGGKKLKFNFDDEELGKPEEKKVVPVENKKNEEEEDRSLILASLLQFFITPPYLVKTMFSPNLNSKFKNILPKFKYAFKLPKITTLPFMNNNNVYKDYKEGIIIPRETPKIKKKNHVKKVKANHKITISKYVNIGESTALELNIKREIPIYSRVTVDIKNKTIISPFQAYGIVGHKGAFGYHVRLVKQFSKLFTQCPIPQGYSSSVYINCDDYFQSNDKIEDLNNVPVYSKPKQAAGEEDDSEPQNILMVLGNYKDLQACFELDKANLEGVESVGQMFDGKLDIPKGVRIEDGVLIGLTKLML